MFFGDLRHCVLGFNPVLNSCDLMFFGDLRHSHGDLPAMLIVVI